MRSKREQVSMEHVIAYLLRFGPLTSGQVNQHFGDNHSGGLIDKMKREPQLKHLLLRNHVSTGKRTLLWYHVEGRKPKEIEET